MLRFKFLVFAGAMAIGSSANAGLTFVGDQGTENFFFTGFSAGGAFNTTSDSFANIYWDQDKDGVFGETGLGENTGNDNSSLDFSFAIGSGQTYDFAIDGFNIDGVTPPSGAVTFAIQNTDSSFQDVTVARNGETAFSDSNGDPWKAAFVVDLNFYGDVVSNIDTGPGLNNPDHRIRLTFTQVPEPTTAGLLGLAGCAMFLRRRRK